MQPQCCLYRPLFEGLCFSIRAVLDFFRKSMTKISENSDLINIHEFMLDVIMVIGVANSR
jgi:hypothetical protein